MITCAAIGMGGGPKPQPWRPGVDDHSRYAVVAAVVPRATGRAVCLALRPHAENLVSWAYVGDDPAHQPFGRLLAVPADDLTHKHPPAHHHRRENTARTTGRDPLNLHELPPLLPPAAVVTNSPYLK
jgi:hypothetical protein